MYSAMQCAERGTLYPDYPFYYSSYISGLGWVNFLILWLKTFGSLDYVFFFLVLLNWVNLWITFLITEKIVEHPDAKYVACYLFMLFPAFSTSSLYLMSETLFLTMVSLSFLLIFYKRWYAMILAGIVISLAEWIRPLAVSWIIAALFFLIINYRSWKYTLLYVASIFTCLFTIAYFTHRNFPDYSFTASTGGVNMIMGANDDATGGYSTVVYGEGKIGYIPNLMDTTKIVPLYSGQTVEGEHVKAYIYTESLTYHQVDSIYRTRAITWIKSHPLKWLSYLPVKLVRMFYTSKIELPTVNQQYFNPMVNLLVKLWNALLTQGIFLISLVGLFFPLRKNKRIVYLLIPIILSVAVSVITVGAPRYNYPFLNLMIVFALYTAIQINRRLRDRIL
jgi:hypothetical protein